MFKFSYHFKSKPTHFKRVRFPLVASPVAQMVKHLPAMQGPGFNPWVRKMPWRGKWLPTPVFLPGEFHSQRNLVGYRTWDRKESDMTERLTLSLSHSFPFFPPSMPRNLSWGKGTVVCSSLAFCYCLLVCSFLPILGRLEEGRGEGAKCHCINI